MLEPTKKKKKKTCPETRKKLQGDRSRSTITTKSILYPLCGWPTDWRTITPKKLSHYCEVSEPQVGLSSLGIWLRDWESPGNLALRASRTWLLEFQRTGGNTNSSLGGHKQNSPYTKIQGRGAVTLQETEAKLPASVEGLLWWHGSAEAHHRDRGTGRSPLV